MAYDFRDKLEIKDYKEVNNETLLYLDCIEFSETTVS
jgi:hypothetical protein